MKRYIFVVSVLLFCQIILTSSQIYAQTVNCKQLAEALEGCEDDLDLCRSKVISLSKALESTEKLYQNRMVSADSLIENLKHQLLTQDSITTLLEANSDTLQMMVKDYSDKLDEVNELYIKELKREARPWFLTRSGLKGLVNGVLIGGALGAITVGVLK
ncbi:MAG: hypothetical protein QME81_06060 [bacterium]|nr:hypothetical protein [bacterium]